MFMERLDRSRNYDRFPFVGLVGLPRMRAYGGILRLRVEGCYSSTSASDLCVWFKSIRDTQSLATNFRSGSGRKARAIVPSPPQR